MSAAGYAMSHGALERRAGDLDAEERVLREAYEVLDGLGDRFFLPTVAVVLADCLALRPVEDATKITALCAAARTRTLEDDLVNFVYLDGIEARLCAWSGRLDEATALARRGLRSAETTDHFDLINQARLWLAEVLAIAGESGEAGGLGKAVISAAHAKGDVTGAAWIESRLREIGVDVDV